MLSKLVNWDSVILYNVLTPVQELTQLQDKHATRPDVFDDVEEEQEIEILTQEITQVHV